MRAIGWLLVGLLGMLLAACQQGGQVCNEVGSMGACKGAYDVMSGREVHNLEGKLFRPGEPVKLDLQADVQGGLLRVHFFDQAGQRITAEATPGRPASVSSVVLPRKGGIPFIYETITVPVEFEVVG